MTIIAVDIIFNSTIIEGQFQEKTNQFFNRQSEKLLVGKEERYLDFLSQSSVSRMTYSGIETNYSSFTCYLIKKSLKI